MKAIKPMAHPPFNPDRLPSEIVESLTHYELDNGLRVSVLHNIAALPVEVWEAWAALPRTGAGHLTPSPLCFDSEPKALAYRDEVGRMPESEIERLVEKRLLEMAA